MDDPLFIQALECTYGYRPFSNHYVKDLIEAGVTCINETVADIKYSPVETIKAIYTFRKSMEPYDAIIVKTASDIERAKKEKKLAIIIGMQHLPFFGAYYPDDMAVLDVYDRLDVKIAQLTYQRRNIVGDGCGERTDAGLSKFGIKVVEEMNKRGMVIDLSHVGPKTTDEAIELSKDPVAITHSNCRALCNHVRNKTDEQIKAMAEKGGVIGMGKFGPLVNIQRIPTFDDFLDHIEHVVELVGIDHVGIGLDYVEKVPVHPDIEVQKRAWEERAVVRANYPELYADAPYYQEFVPGGVDIKELDEPSKWKPNIANGLAGRGYSSSEIEKVLGLNFLRVFKKVWRT
jgi:membrane dipeptidase